MRFDIKMDEDLGRRFREKAMKQFEYKQGAFKNAFEEAIKDWLQKEQIGEYK